jgi:hypothetical protein
MSVYKPEGGPVDALVKMHPSVVAGFFANSSIFRSIIQRQSNSPLIIPERGAWPIYAAASGFDGIESTLDDDVDTVRLPIGSFYIDDQDDIEKPRGTLSSVQKKNILIRTLGDRVGKMVVLDEVQGGGTSSELMYLLRRVIPPTQFEPHVLIAALDNRPKVAANPKNQKYTRIATGNVSGVETAAIPVPLIATDKEALLNTLVYDGGKRHPIEEAPDIKIIDNTEATELFRQLGSFSRSLDALHSGDSIEGLFDRPVLEKTDARLERWVGVFTSVLQKNAPSYQRSFMVDWPKADNTPE